MSGNSLEEKEQGNPSKENDLELGSCERNCDGTPVTTLSIKDFIVKDRTGEVL